MVEPGRAGAASRVPQIPLADVLRVPAKKTGGFSFCPSPRVVQMKEAQKAIKAAPVVEVASSQGGSQTIKVIDESMFDDYEPTQAEVEEYAEWLGIDLATEQHLLWIAREARKAPCPAPWKPCETEDGDIFFFNFKTGDSVWDHPCDVHYKKLHQEHRSRSAGNNPSPVPSLCLSGAQLQVAGASDLCRSPRKLTARVKHAAAGTAQVATASIPGQTTKPKVTVLEEEPPDTEPPQELINEYAVWLGMDLEADKDLMWIARAGLMAPCPENWKPCMTEDEEVFYFNFKTGESIWDHPCDQQYKDSYQEHKGKANQ